MKNYIYSILFFISLLFGCDDSLEKEVFNLHLESFVKVEKKANVINDLSTKEYSLIKGDKTIIEYIKNYDEKNSIDEEYWSKILIEFDENEFDFDTEYSRTNNDLKIYLQSGSFDGKLDFDLKSGSFKISKIKDSYILNILNDIIGNQNEIDLVFIKKGEYLFGNGSN